MGTLLEKINEKIEDEKRSMAKERFMQGIKPPEFSPPPVIRADYNVPRRYGEMSRYGRTDDLSVKEMADLLLKNIEQLQRMMAEILNNMKYIMGNQSATANKIVEINVDSEEILAILNKMATKEDGKD